MSQSWQHNQRRMVRDRVAFVRFSLNAEPIQFNRVDVRIPGHVEGLDGWGAIREIDSQSRSMWIDPIGRQFNRLSDAIQQIAIDRCNHRFA